MNASTNRSGQNNIILKEQFEDTRSDGYAYLRQYIVTGDGSGNRNIYLNWYNTRKDDIIKIKFTVFQYDANGEELSRTDIEWKERIKGESFFGGGYNIKGNKNIAALKVVVRAIDYLGYSVRFDGGKPTEYFPPKKSDFIKRADKNEPYGEEFIYGKSRPLIVTFIVIALVVLGVMLFERINGFI